MARSGALSASRTVIVKLSHNPPGAELDGVVAEYFEAVANTPLPAQ